MKSIILILCILAGVSCLKSGTYTISYQYDEMGHFLLPIIIGDDTLNGVFDTGSPRSVILNTDVDNLHLPLSSDSSLISFIFLSKDILQRPLTTPIPVKIGSNLLSHQIQFCVIPKTTKLNNPTWGLDIINQFCWYFDTQKQTVVVSENPLDIKKSDYIAIPYRLENGNMLINLNMFGEFSFPDIKIDTGKGTLKLTNEEFSIFLEISENHPHIENILNYIRSGSIADDNKVYLNPDKIPLKKQSLERKLEIEYYGLFFSRPGSTLRMNGYKFLDGTEGVLGISYGGAFSALYLDTKNQVLYLKPN